MKDKNQTFLKNSHHFFFYSMFVIQSKYPRVSMLSKSKSMSKSMLVNRESTFKLPIKKSEFWSMIFSAIWKVFFTVKSIIAKDFKIGTKNFASF